MSQFKEYFFKEFFQKDTDELISTGNIELEKDTVESIIALVNKTLEDWNREKKLNGDEIKKVVINAFKLGLIKVS